MIARFASGEAIVRYEPAPPMTGTTGEIEAPSMWAGLVTLVYGVWQIAWSGLGTDAPSEEKSLRLAREELAEVRAVARDRQAS